MLNAFKKTKKQKHVKRIENPDKLKFLSKKDKLTMFIVRLLSKKRINNIRIDVIRNFLDAEIFSLSSKKPKKNIAEHAKKKVIKIYLSKNIISFESKFSLKNTNRI
tara:strand:+ start:1272 stop:1589 length:318 start_codon:yes stop_codon:yes gene_type:complete